MQNETFNELTNRMAQAVTRRAAMKRFGFRLAAMWLGTVLLVDLAKADPTFSDANWIGMGGIPGANGTVNAAVVDGLGNLYIGGSFTAVGEVLVNNIAKWNGSSW